LDFPPFAANNLTAACPTPLGSRAALLQKSNAKQQRMIVERSRIEKSAFTTLFLLLLPGLSEVPEVRQNNSLSDRSLPPTQDGLLPSSQSRPCLEGGIETEIEMTKHVGG
jgi:hypothetical protein